MHVGAHLRMRPRSQRIAACRTGLAIPKAMRIRPPCSSAYDKHVTWMLIASLMPQSERNLSASWILYTFPAAELKRCCVITGAARYYTCPFTLIKIPRYVLFDVRLKLAVIIKDHRRQIEQSHFVDGMEFLFFDLYLVLSLRNNS